MGMCQERSATSAIMLILRCADFGNESLHDRIVRGHVSLEPSPQLFWREMEVQPRRFQAFVPSKQGDIFQRHTSALEDGTPQVSEGMRSEGGQTDALTETFQDLVECANCQG